MALTSKQKKLMRKALVAGWFKQPTPHDFRVTIQDLEDLAAMSDDDVISVIEEYKTVKLQKLHAKKLNMNTLADDTQTEMDELNS
jgi:hypothetical protein